jgi:hypothetical protein
MAEEEREAARVAVGRVVVGQEAAKAVAGVVVARAAAGGEEAMAGAKEVAEVQEGPGEAAREVAKVAERVAERAEAGAAAGAMAEDPVEVTDSARRSHYSPCQGRTRRRWIRTHRRRKCRRWRTGTCSDKTGRCPA